MQVVFLKAFMFPHMKRKEKIALTIRFSGVYAWKNKMYKRLWCISLQLICHV